MASFYDPNHPSGPFWDALASAFENHPFLASQGQGHPRPPPSFWGWGNHHHSHHHHRGPHPHPFWGWATQPDDQDRPRDSETPRAEHQSTESTAGPSGSAEKSRDAEKDSASTPGVESESEQRPHGRCGKGKHRGSPPGFGRGPGRCGPGRDNHHGAGPFGHHGRGGHHCGGRGGRSRHRGGPRPPFNAGPGFANFDFLRNIASQFGVHLSGPIPEGVDFVPSVDVFNTPASYIVHVSLPGAKKDDLSIDYDPDESILRLAGVVYRPGINEDLHQALTVEERSREVGVFEREVRLGSHEASAAISIHEITAKLEDGVLIVTLPKIEPEPEKKKKIVVEDGNVENEKDVMQVDETASETMTPSGSDESDFEDGETKEYVNVQVK